MSDVSRELPWVVSADDHVIEPPHLWWDRLSKRDREVGPRVVRDTYGTTTTANGATKYVKGGDGPMTDWWVYEDTTTMVSVVSASVGFSMEEHSSRPLAYAEMRPGCYDPVARLADMDLNQTERSLCFPNMTRFCGQIFHEMKDKKLGMACVGAYNDWMIDEWCAAGPGRLIPLCLIPLWDPVAAAAEIRRNAARGSRAITFPEMPHYLGLPSIHDPSGFWEPVFDACNETDTLVCMHVGSGSRLVEASPFAPQAVVLGMKHDIAQISCVEWLSSGLLARYPRIKIIYSEAQIGWMPYVFERLDKVYTEHYAYADFPPEMTELPSTYVEGRVFASFFDDDIGIKNRDAIGVGQILFEVDYPHQDTTWPHTPKVVERMAGLMSAEDLEKVVRTNTLEMLGLPDTLPVPSR
jgi:predicted TIM-barrel fold metal-dependent hydrolase